MPLPSSYWLDFNTLGATGKTAADVSDIMKVAIAAGESMGIPSNVTSSSLRGSSVSAVSSMATHTTLEGTPGKRTTTQALVIRSEASYRGRANINVKYNGIPVPKGTKVDYFGTSNNMDLISYTHISSSGNSSRYGWIPTGNLATELSSTSNVGGSSYSRALPTNTFDTTWTNYELGTSYYDFSDAPASSSRVVSARESYDTPFTLMTLPGFSPARMIAYVESGGSVTSHSFEFLVGPRAYSENNTNNVTPIKTGNGYILIRSGAGLPRLTLNGFFVETNDVDERRLFMEKYYKEYLTDKVNAFNSYFNNNTLELELEGYTYQGILTSLDLTRTTDSMFLYQYSMSLLIVSKTLKENIVTPSSRHARTTIISTVIPEVVRISQVLSMCSLFI